MDKPDVPRPRPYRRGPHWTAIVATAATWPLLFVGGLVTTYKVGMAVPDWPTTFGINMFVYDFMNAPWGVYVEHTHRLLGTVVGLGCIALAAGFTTAGGRRAWRPVLAAVTAGAALAAAWIGATDVSPFLAAIVALAGTGVALAAWFAAVERKALPALGWLALALVIAQGALGGYRVRLNSTDLAAVHGCTGQAFFAVMVSLCVVTGRVWSGGGRHRGGGAIRWAAAGVALMVYGQIVIGALLRHRSLGLASHAGYAVLVLLAVLGLAAVLLAGRRRWPELAPSAAAAAVLVVVQVGLGVASWWVLRPFDGIARPVDRVDALVRTAHQANGALLLAATVVLALRAFRHLGPAGDGDRPAATLTTQNDLELATR